MGEYILGLDIGSRSVGWVLINNGKRKKIADIGVRVFPEGVDRDTKGMEKSRNVDRREARGTRRNRARFHRRKSELVKVLRSKGLFPNKKEEANLFMTNPYELRAKGLDERLEKYELGRILYHLNQRRGFKSNRKTDKGSDSNKIAKGAGELAAKIEDGGFKTLGEYLYSINKEDGNVRGYYTFRKMYEDEFDKLWEKQSEYYPDILTDDLKCKIRDDIIFYQRPLKPTDDLIGDCELEQGQKRCSRGDWYAIRFRILQDINNLRIIGADGNERELKEEERNKMIDLLSKSKEVKFSRIHKELALIESQRFNFEYEVGDKGKKREKLKGNEFNSVMRSKNIFGTKFWDVMADEEKIRLNEWLVDLDDDELIEKLSGEYGLIDEQIEKVMKISLPSGYMSFSREAFKKLLPLMEQGKRTDEAIKEVYPDRGKYEEEQLDRLPLPEDLRNPIVNKALFEVRKVVNAILQEYGKLNKIKIEMARDTKNNAKQRKEMLYRQWENQRENDRARERLIEDMGILNPSRSRDDIIKYKLWEECGKVCPYTGKVISLHLLFGEHPEFQIEHILPYSRSLDDSYMNKTLCDVTENRLKGEKTPWEYYSDKEEQYEKILQRVQALPWPKRKKFSQKDLKIDECIQRELNDTRYICREVVKYLKKVCRNVQGTRGRITAELRHQWGLNSILNLEAGMKNRDDHRHHAIDAAVIAVTRNEHLRDLARCKYSKEKFGKPWEDFREELEERVRHINVSHRVCRKVSGSLHEETAYGPTGEKDSKDQEYFVCRKPLESLTAKMVGKIVDPVVRNLVEERIESVGGDLKKAWEEPLYMKCKDPSRKIPIKKVRIRDVFNNMIMMKDREGNVYRAVSPGSNHHIEIFEYKDKNDNTKRDGEVISMFKAVQRSRRGEDVVCRDYGDGKKFVCSLSINEMFLMETEDNDMELHRVQKMTQSQGIILRPHTYGGQVKDTDSPPIIQRKSPNTLKGRKVTVDPLGRIFSAND